mmetsp:Transcript_15936/g.40335  ORF Transcript_15936/g.40335 Transcript_15936/m.40335 type:complete len:233 (+) Transcript_15936:365-1063(+)
MHVCFYSLASDFFRCVEEWANINIKSNVSKACSDDLCTTIMSILSHLCNQNARSPTFGVSKGFHFVQYLLQGRVLAALEFTAVRPAHHLISWNMTTPCVLKGFSYFPNCAPCPRCINGQRQQIFALYVTCCLAQCSQASFCQKTIPFSFYSVQSLNLLCSHSRVINVQNINSFLFQWLVLVYTNNSFLATINPRLFACSTFFNTQLWHALSNRLCHPSNAFHFFNNFHSFLL